MFCPFATVNRTAPVGAPTPELTDTTASKFTWFAVPGLVSVMLLSEVKVIDDAALMIN
jgi:hypothetical protein